MSIYGTNDKFNTPDPELSQEKRDDTLHLRSGEWIREDFSVGMTCEMNLEGR